LEIEPTNSVFLYNTGVLANSQGNLDEAVIMLEKSIEMNNENVYSYLALGDVFEK